MPGKCDPWITSGGPGYKPHDFVFHPLIFPGFLCPWPMWSTEVSGTVLRIDSPSEGGFVTAPWRQVFTTLMKLWESKDDGNYRSGGFLKWWVSPRTIGFFLLKMTILGCFGGYHHFRKHPYKYCISFFVSCPETPYDKNIWIENLDACWIDVPQKSFAFWTFLDPLGSHTEVV